MAQTFSNLVRMLKLKSFTSAATNLTDSEILDLCNDSYRSFIVPFLKSLRDEWNVAVSDAVLYTDSNSQVTIPNSVASTMRTVSWLNSGLLYPLTRIEPENAFGYQQGSNIPLGYMLKGYQMVVLPIQSSRFEIHISYMKRPPEGVLDEDAGEIASHAGLVLTLASTPLSWQATAPSVVDLISNNSPFSLVAESVAVSSLSGTTLTLTGIDTALVENGFWVADVGYSPFPNIPTELHPLLEADVNCTLLNAAGDKRLKSAMEVKAELKKDLLKLMAPRAQGNARVVVNSNAPGMTAGRWGRGW